jgi:hypothetical protein
MCYFHPFCRLLLAVDADTYVHAVAGWLAPVGFMFFFCFICKLCAVFFTASLCHPQCICLMLVLDCATQAQDACMD